MENGHCWDSGFGKSALFSLLFSDSVLNGHGHLFSYRTYYSINSLAWEGEKYKSSQIHCPCSLFCCPAHTVLQLQPIHALVCAIRPHTLLTAFQVLRNSRSSHELLLAVLLFFLHCPCLWLLLIWDQMLVLGVTEQTDRHPQDQGTVASNLDKTVQSLPTCHEFFKNSLKICVAVVLIRPGIHQQASKIHQMTDKPDQLKPKGLAKHVESVRIKNCYTLNQHYLIIFHLLWVSVF